MNKDEIRARLREIDEDLAQLRRDLPQPTDDPRDFGDAGQDLAAREELLGQIEVMEGERDRLRGQLDGN